MGMVNREHVGDRQTAESRVQVQNPRTPTLKSKGQTGAHGDNRGLSWDSGGAWGGRGMMLRRPGRVRVSAGVSEEALRLPRHP